MEDIRQQFNEIEQLKALQEQHRQELRKNRERALQKKNETKQLVMLGKFVTKLLPDIVDWSEEELMELVKKKLTTDSTQD